MGLRITNQWESGSGLISVIHQGAFRIIYDDGSEEVLKVGNVFYLPAGHTAIVDEDLKCIMFSPNEEHDEVLTHAMKKMAEVSE